MATARQKKNMTPKITFSRYCGSGEIGSQDLSKPFFFEHEEQTWIVAAERTAFIAICGASKEEVELAQAQATSARARQDFVGYAKPLADHHLVPMSELADWAKKSVSHKRDPQLIGDTLVDRVLLAKFLGELDDEDELVRLVLPAAPWSPIVVKVEQGLGAIRVVVMPMSHDSGNRYDDPLDVLEHCERNDCGACASLRKRKLRARGFEI